MNQEIILKAEISNTTEAKFVFTKIDEIAELLGIGKVEMSMKNKKKKLFGGEQ